MSKTTKATKATKETKEKKCKKCLLTKNINEFYISRTIYYQTCCKMCYNEGRKSKKNPHRKLTDIQLQFIKDNYFNISCSKISLQLGYSSGWLRKNIRKLNIIPENQLRKRGKPRKTKSD